jgi:hypothetical protein
MPIKLGSLSPGATGSARSFIGFTRTTIRQLAKLEGGNEYDKAVREAVRKAVKEAGKGAIRQHAVEKIANFTKVPATAIKKASRVTVTSRDRGLRVWFGLNPVSLKYLNPKQTPTGVTAGPANIPGGFISKKLGGHVFVRKGLKRPAPAGVYEGQMRQALKKEYWDIRKSGLDAVKYVNSVLLQSFENKLGFYINSELKTRGL